MIAKYTVGTNVNVAPEMPCPERPPQQSGAAMLTPTGAWRSLCIRTGGSIAKVTFYRWLRNGRIYSIRLGQRIFIPQAALEDFIKECLAGERF
jgi:excisionase family DNA binding protein